MKAFKIHIKIIKNKSKESSLLKKKTCKRGKNKNQKKIVFPNEP